MPHNTYGYGGRSFRSEAQSISKIAAGSYGNSVTVHGQEVSELKIPHNMVVAAEVR